MRRLKQLADDGERGAARKIVRQALREGAKPVVAAAKERVPIRSGRLRRAIRLSGAKARRGRIAVAVGVRQSSELGPYAAAIEGGSKVRSTRAGANRGRVVGTHFLSEALNQTASTATGIVAARIRLGLERFAARNA